MKTNFYTKKVNPLLTTQWYQSYPCNMFCPSSHPAGCASVALSQIMRFHKKPANLSLNINGVLTNIYWTNLPNNPDLYDYGNVPHLIYFSGIITNTTYSSLGSWALLGDIVDGARNYYNVTRKNHSANDVTSEICNLQNPVFMAGFPLSYLNGHYWVCDGYDRSNQTVDFFIEFINPYSYTYSTQGYYTPNNPGNSFLYDKIYYHMNWGWDGSSDGWYYDNTFPSGYNFSYYRENLYMY